MSGLLAQQASSIAAAARSRPFSSCCGHRSSLRRRLTPSARAVHRQQLAPCVAAADRQSAATHGVTLAAAAAVQLAVLTGGAWAEPAPDAAPQESVLPSLPSPPEIVRSLSEQFFGSGQQSSETAPSLTDSPEQTDAEKDEARERESKELAQLQAKFEKSILPKIKSQIAGLDQQKEPNDAIVQLRKDLQTAEDDIKQLVADAKDGNSDAAHAEAQRLQKEFNDIRDFVKANGGELVS